MADRIYFYIQRAIRYLKKLVTYHSFYYDLLTEYSGDLESGEYRLFWDQVRFFWMKADKTLWKNILSGYTFKAKVKILLAKKHAEVHSSSNVSLGTELVVSRRHTSVKVINRSQKRMVDYYLTNQDYETTFNFWRDFSPYFGTTILSFDPEHLKAMETLVCNKNDWKADLKIKRNCICWFMNNLADYYKNTLPICYETAEEIIQKIRSYNVFGNIEKRSLADITELLSYGIGGIEKEKIPFVNSHCDLTFFNILYDGEKFYLIDWEYYHTTVFCFDCLYWMSYEAMVNNDYSYLDKYLAGEYDNLLEQIFDAAKVVFSKEKRKSYMYLMLLALLEKHLFFLEMGSARSYADFKKVINYLNNKKGKYA